MSCLPFCREELVKELLEGPPVLVWPASLPIPDPVPVAGYSLRVLTNELETAWVAIQHHATPRYGESELKAYLEAYRQIALTDGILIAVVDTTEEPVASAGAIKGSFCDIFPGGGELGWVATIPSHQQRGLSRWLNILLTSRLRKDGFEALSLSTSGDMRANRAYRQLGYVPCLYAADQEDNWRQICEATGTVFEPERWPTPEQYLSSLM